MREQNVEFQVNGQTGAGYFVRPDSDAPAPGVVVIQEWWGVDEHIHDLTRRFAEQGFVAIAPDLYHGRVVPTNEPNEATAKSPARAMMLASISWLPLGPSESAAVAPAAPVICMKLLRPEAVPTIPALTPRLPAVALGVISPLEQQIRIIGPITA